MNIPLTLLIFLLLMSCSYVTFAESQHEQTTFPPLNNKPTLLWLVEDKKENIGLMDKASPNLSAATSVERHVIFALEQYNIQVQRVTSKRINQLLQTTDNACVANRAKLKEREAYSLYSTPQSFYLTHKLFRFNQQAPLPKELLTVDNELKSINALFDHWPLHRIGMAEGISFGAYLDDKIKALSPNNIYMRGGTKRVSALEGMLYAGRVDYLLALPVDMNPTETQQAQLEQYSILGAPKFVVAHFSCSKSEFGQQAIADINQILIHTYTEPTFNALNGKWYSDTDLAYIQSYLKQTFIDNTGLANQ